MDFPSHPDMALYTMDWPSQSSTSATAGQHQLPMLYPQQAPSQHSYISPIQQDVARSSPSYLSRGYVAHMFGSVSSRTFWAAVLKVFPENVQPQEVNSTSPLWRIATHDLSAGPQNAGRLLDYSVEADYVTGPVIPQRLWQPLYRRIREVLVDNTRLCMPIFFIVHDTGHVGLSLVDALAKKHYLLYGHSHVVDLGGKVTTHIRMLWRGYAEYKRQIQIQDQTRDRNPITLGRLVEHVARTVQRFIENPPETNEDDYDARWRVGPQGIKVEDVVLVGVLHTSAGTWQPILRLNRTLPNAIQIPSQSTLSPAQFPSAGQHTLSSSQPQSSDRFAPPGTSSPQYASYSSTPQPTQAEYVDDYQSSPSHYGCYTCP